MLVQVRFDADSNARNARTYTYMWPDSAVDQLVPGDRVVVPSSAFHDEAKLATVVRLDSDYSGTVKDLLGVVRGPEIVGPDGRALE